jgi:hypothetical protein
VTAVDDRLLKLAADVGRLRRHLDAESYGGFLAARVADHVNSLDCMLEPTAGELYAAGLSVEEALGTVDERAETLRRLLGGDS